MVAHIQYGKQKILLTGGKQGIIKIWDMNLDLLC